MTARDAVPAVSTIAGPGGCWPTPLQELLLDAALMDRDRALEAFAEWVAATGFDEIDSGTFRMLPLAAHNFNRLGITNKWSAHLRGTLRRTWYENQVMLHAALPAVDVLQSAGIDVVVFKGAALAVLEYGSLDVRPMDDLDVLVPEDRAAEALRALLDSGVGAGRRPASPADRCAPRVVSPVSSRRTAARPGRFRSRSPLARDLRLVLA